MRAAITTILFCAFLCGCAHTTEKPNSPQKWGFVSYLFPWTDASKARRAEKKQDKTEGVKKEFTKAVDDLLVLGDASSSTNVSIRAAKVVSGYNVIAHGTPTKPIPVEPLISTNNESRDRAWRELNEKYEKLQAQLEFIRQQAEKSKERGVSDVKQDSSASAIAWEVKDAILKFISRHWFLITVLVILIFYAAKAALFIWNPAVAIGVNRVTNLGINGLRRGFAEITKGGELFKESLQKRYGPKGSLSVEEAVILFRESQQRAQSSEIQEAIRELTKKEI